MKFNSNRVHPVDDEQIVPNTNKSQTQSGLNRITYHPDWCQVTTDLSEALRVFERRIHGQKQWNKQRILSQEIAGEPAIIAKVKAQLMEIVKCHYQVESCLCKSLSNNLHNPLQTVKASFENHWENKPVIDKLNIFLKNLERKRNIERKIFNSQKEWDAEEKRLSQNIHSLKIAIEFSTGESEEQLILRSKLSLAIHTYNDWKVKEKNYIFGRQHSYDIAVQNLKWCRYLVKTIEADRLRSLTDILLTALDELSSTLTRSVTEEMTMISKFESTIREINPEMEAKYLFDSFMHSLNNVTENEVECGNVDSCNPSELMNTMTRLKERALAWEPTEQNVVPSSGLPLSNKKYLGKPMDCWVKAIKSYKAEAEGDISLSRDSLIKVGYGPNKNGKCYGFKRNRKTKQVKYGYFPEANVKLVKTPDNEGDEETKNQEKAHVKYGDANKIQCHTNLEQCPPTQAELNNLIVEVTSDCSGGVSHRGRILSLKQGRKIRVTGGMDSLGWCYGFKLGKRYGFPVCGYFPAKHAIRVKPDIVSDGSGSPMFGGDGDGSSQIH